MPYHVNLVVGVLVKHTLHRHLASLRGGSNAKVEKLDSKSPALELYKQLREPARKASARKADKALKDLVERNTSSYVFGEAAERARKLKASVKFVGAKDLEKLAAGATPEVDDPSLSNEETEDEVEADGLEAENGQRHV